MRSIRLAALGLLLTSTTLLAGCGSPGTTEAALPGGAVAADTMLAPEAAAKPAVTQPQVIETAQLDVRVDDVAQGAAAITSAIQAAHGTISQQDTTNIGDQASATIVARIPADALDGFLLQIAGIGTVERTSRQAVDVTAQTIDLDARIEVLTASIQRLTAMLASTTNVADLVAVETELANRQAELDSLTAQRRYLADQVAMSTVTITVTPTAPGTGTSIGFLGGLANGWAALIALASGLIVAAGFAIPYLVIAGVVLAIVWGIWRIRRRRHMADS